MEKVTLVEDAAASEIAQRIAQLLSSARLNVDDRVSITVPGGSTPFPIFKELVGLDLNWPSIVVWPGDDRIVPEDHEASNTGKIRAIFEPAGAKVQALTEEAEPPRFALAWLGMGDDGHIASLFPNTDPQIDDPQQVRRLTPDPLPPHAPFDRITLTIPSLLNSDALLLTLGGSKAKRAVLEGAIAGEHDLPIARLLKAAKERNIPVTCFI